MSAWIVAYGNQKGCAPTKINRCAAFLMIDTGTVFMYIHSLGKQTQCVNYGSVPLQGEWHRTFHAASVSRFFL